MKGIPMTPRIGIERPRGAERTRGLNLEELVVAPWRIVPAGQGRFRGDLLPYRKRTTLIAAVLETSHGEAAFGGRNGVLHVSFPGNDAVLDPRTAASVPVESDIPPKNPCN
jgi:hypothetical protein